MRLLILGGGAVVTEYYLPALKLLGWLTSTLVVDPSVRSLTALRTEFPEVAVWQADFRLALRDDNREQMSRRFDAVVIALPNWLHTEAVLRCLDYGLHVLCEKPLSLSRNECYQMAAAAEQTQLILAVGMTRRLLPSFVAVRHALEQGLIGELISVDIQDGSVFSWLSDSGAFFDRRSGGILADMGVHYLDLVEDLVGPLSPLAVQDDWQGGVEANVVYELQTASGVPLRLELSWIRSLRNTAIFRGTRGSLVVAKDRFDSCQWLSADGSLQATLFPERPFSGGDWLASFNSCFTQQFVEFAEAIDRRQAPRVTAQQAASTVELIEWAYAQRQSAWGAYSVEPGKAELPPGRTLVTGGTGFIGTNLIERLVNQGLDQIVVPVRHYRSCAAIARFPIEMPRVDLLDYQAVQAVVRGARRVFHLAYGRDGANAAAVTIEGTRNVVEAAIAAGCEAVVVLSTMFVYGYPPSATVDESWPYQPYGGEYGRSKAQMERWCLERSRSSGGTRIIVLNPSCVYGPHGKTFTVMPLQMAQKGQFCWIEQGRGLANFTYIDNLIDAMLQAATCEAAHGQRFIINDGTTTWRKFLTPFLGDLAEQIPDYSVGELRQLHQHMRSSLKDVARAITANQDIIDLFTRTTFFYRLSTYAPEVLHQARLWRRSVVSHQQKKTVTAEAVHTQSALPPEWLAELFGSVSTTFSSRKASDVLGWAPRVALDFAQCKTVEWMRSQNCQLEVPT